jgi:hypothetical protein
MSNPTQQESTYLADLALEESSAVDKPAHLQEGWMVLKNQDPLDEDKLAELLTTAEEIAKHDLGNMMPHGDPGNTTDVTKRSYTGTDYAECVRVSVETDGMTPEAAAQYCKLATGQQTPGGAAVTKDADAPQTDWEAIVKAKDEELAAKDAEIAALKIEKAPADESDDPIKKALDDYEVPEAIQKVLLDQRAELEKVSAIAKAEKDARETAEFIEKAKEYRSLSVKPEEFGPVLKRIAQGESTAEDVEKIEETLKAAKGAIDSGKLFAELGSGATAEDESAYAKLEAKAEAYAKENNVTVHKAMEAVTNTPEGRELYEEHRAAVRKGA